MHWRVLASNRVMTFNAGFRRILLTSRLALHNKREFLAHFAKRREIRVFTQDGSLFLRWITQREFQRSSSSWDLPGWWAAKPDWHALKRGAKTVIIFRGQKLEVWRGGGKGRVMWQIRVGGWRWMRNEASGYEMASMINQNDSLYVSRKNVQSRRFYTQLYKWVPVNCQWRLMKCWGRGGEGGGEGGREGGGESKPQWNGNH